MRPGLRYEVVFYRPRQLVARNIAQRWSEVAVGFNGEAPQEEIEIAAHDQMWGQGHLKRRAISFHKKLMKHAKRHESLRAWTLVDGGGDRAGSDLLHQGGEEVCGDDGQIFQHAGVARGVQRWNRSFRGDVNSGQVRVSAKQFFALIVCLGLNVVVFKWLLQKHFWIERPQRVLEGIDF